LVLKGHHAPTLASEAAFVHHVQVMVFGLAGVV
jgi:hypothetical protein